MSSRHRRPSSTAWPDTSMAAAYLSGLVAWVARQHPKNPEAMTMLPIGPAKVGEVAQVLRALNRARSNQRSSTAARRFPRNLKEQ
jgi:hypothetical protein